MDITAPSTSPPKILEPTKTSYRIDSIDLLRGLVMIIMALDHTRDFFHKDGMTGDPLNLATTTPMLYFTRWITHFCAPTFVLLAGSSAYFQSLRKSKAALSKFLITRGLWLLFVEIVIINFAFSFDIHYSIIGLQTIWSIGISMIILGCMIWLPFNAILILGSVIVLGHNALDYYEKSFTSQPPWWYSFIHIPSFYKLWDGHFFGVLYPFLPWSGLMMVGYCFGKLFVDYEGEKRKKILFWTGLGTILFYALLRYTNNYGNPGHWAAQKTPLYTFFSFMNVQKYPPSILYMCATIGPAILFLAFFGNRQTKLGKFITVYGRVPFFYYILHFFLLHFVTSICFLARGHSYSEGFQGAKNFVPNFMVPGEGFSLLWVYIIWILVVLSLYYPCKWFSDYKQQHREKKWLSYL